MNIITSKSIQAFLFSLSASIILFSCQGGGENQGTNEMQEEIKDPVSTETEIKLDLVINDIPSPVDLTTVISESEANYSESLLLSTSKASNFGTSNKKGFALGIYGADLGYNIAFNQTQKSLKYLAVCKKLGDELGISKGFDQELIKKFEENLGQKDSLVKIIFEAYKKADKHLRSDQRVSTAAVILTGGWVEGFYLSTSSAIGLDKSEANEALYKKIGGQKYSLKNVTELLESYKDNEGFPELIEKLKPIEKSFRKINRPSQMTPDHVKELNEKVKEVRAYLIS